MHGTEDEAKQDDEERLSGTPPSVAATGTEPGLDIGGHAVAGTVDGPPVDDLGALADEARVVEEAASRPAGDGPSRRDETENSFLFAALTLAVLLFFGWIAGTTLLDFRRELEALRDRVARVEVSGRSDRVARDRAALARARAELEGLEHTLSPDLAKDVGAVRRSLNRISERLDAR